MYSLPGIVMCVRNALLSAESDAPVWSRFWPAPDGAQVHGRSMPGTSGVHHRSVGVTSLAGGSLAGSAGNAMRLPLAVCVRASGRRWIGGAAPGG